MPIELELHLKAMSISNSILDHLQEIVEITNPEHLRDFAYVDPRDENGEVNH